MYQVLSIKKGFLLGLFVVFLNAPFALSQNCGAILTVEKDRNVKSAYEDDAASFNMLLKNTSARTVTYLISTKNLKESCANDIHKTSAANVSLNVMVKNNQNAGPAVSSLTLAPGETRKFNISVAVPANTAKNRWSCIEVFAKGEGCSQPADSTVLRVYVPENSNG